MRLDSLWSIAERVLGDGERWGEIADLNEGQEMSDGTRFSAAAPIQPGWVLRVPGEARSNVPHEVTVRPGDSLSSLAHEHLGDAQAYPLLAEATAGVIQPGGARLTDPDLIQPGWTVRIPGADAAEVAVPAPPTPAPRVPHPDVAGPEEQTSQQPAPAPQTEAPSVEAAKVQTTEVDSPQDEPQEAASTSDDPAEQRTDLLALRALLATATCLAAGAFVMVVRNRRRQFKQRGIGRAIAPTPPVVGEREESVVLEGVEAQVDAEFVDRALRHIAAVSHARGTALPLLAAVILSAEELTVLLDEPASAPAPEGWIGSVDNTSWALSRETYLDESLDSQPAPYPALVTVGRDSAGRTWLLDLEALGDVGVSGDSAQAAALVRFVVAELAVNAWAEGTEVLVSEGLSETVQMNPARLRTATPEQAAARVRAVTHDIEEATVALQADVLARRVTGQVLDSTHPLVVVVSAETGEELRSRLSPVARSRAVVIHHDPTAPQIVVSEDGIAYVPRWNVALTAMAMTADQAEAMADLLSVTRMCSDGPVPDDTSDGVLAGYAKVDGSLLDEFRTERTGDTISAASLLPDVDETYLSRAATTTEDLAEVAPSVSAEAAEALEEIDPDLAADLAAWFDPDAHRPKVRLLGPVMVTAAQGGDTSSLSNLAGTTSFIAFLACRDRGVTGEAAAAVFGWQTQRTVQNRATDARHVLGHRPDGSDWLPDASKTEGARRGNPTYELDCGPGGVLVDADLFRRLRFRAMKRGGQAGQDDLLLALSLVDGAPFESATDRRYPWLFRGQRLDDVMTCAIEDVAHIVANHALAGGDIDTARWAAEIAREANPHGEASWLDLAATLDASQGAKAAEALLREHLGDPAVGDALPRTEGILDRRAWLAS